jgi:hypothetical protein
VPKNVNSGCLRDIQVLLNQENGGSVRTSYKEESQEQTLLEVMLQNDCSWKERLTTGSSHTHTHTHMYIV